MNTFIIIPEHSDILNRFVELHFPSACDKRQVSAIVYPIDPGLRPVWIVSREHRWPESASDEDRAAELSLFQTEVLFDRFERGTPDEDFDGLDLDIDGASHIYLGCGLVIRGAETDEPLCPRDAEDMRRFLCALPSGKVRFSLSVFMRDRCLAKGGEYRLSGKIAIDSGLVATDSVMPEGYEDDPVAMFFRLLSLYNGFGWRRRIALFLEDSLSDLKELIYESIYSDCN